MIKLKPQPELVLVQIMDNDIVCPAKASDFAAFRRTLISALRIIAKRSPTSRMFLVSQFGSPQTWWKAASPSPSAVPVAAWHRPCSLDTRLDTDARSELAQAAGHGRSESPRGGSADRRAALQSQEQAMRGRGRDAGDRTRPVTFGL
jgi:hypothetical protein